MESPPTIDLAALASPIADVDPASAKLFLKLSGKFNELIREERPEQFHEGDPRRDTPKKADWPAVIDLARETLAARVKDLRVACWLTMGLAEVHCFAGVRDGLRLLSLLVERCWDSLVPAGPDARGRADVIARILDDAEAGLAFPHRVRHLPIVRGARQGYGYVHYRRPADLGLEVDAEDLAAAVEQASLQDCRQLAEEMAQALDALEQLRTAFAAHASDAVPGLTNLRTAVEDCQRWVAELVTQKRPNESGPAIAIAGTAPPTTNGQVAGTVGVAATREQAYQQLKEVARTLRRLEPSSPVPCLLDLAGRLAELPFPELMRTLAETQLIAALIRDDGARQQLGEKLGG